MTSLTQASLLAVVACMLIALSALNPEPADAQTTGASDACHTSLEADYGAATITESFERNSGGRRWVHTEAELQDGRTVSYRCMVSYGTVRRVDILDGDWTAAPRIAPVPEPEEADEPETAEETDVGPNTPAPARRLRLVPGSSKGSGWQTPPS
ncbi:MAG: hypothetical protein AAGC57_08015 [Pseudomonadota bacterium]